MQNQSAPKEPIVLVVEDEPLLRMYAVSIVEDAGFTAVEAANADEAVAILDARTDIGIVFTDIDMPGSMNGLRLSQAIRRRWPPIELILTSGHFTLPYAEMPARGVFFGKPYDPTKIMNTLHVFADRAA
jgi:DNA-binding NtrC family response regulator